MHSRPAAPDRRSRVRGTPEGEPTRTQLVSTILGTFCEMPGLSLQLDQAARLFGLRRMTCDVVLGDLVAEGRLRRAGDGQYRRGENESAARQGSPAMARRL